MPESAKFHPGQIVHHLKFGYRGVVVDVDATYCGSEEWYRQVARSRPPRDRPWYHVLVDDADHRTYVAERHLAPADDLSRIRHPALDREFSGYADGRYVKTGAAH